MNATAWMIFAVYFLLVLYGFGSQALRVLRRRRPAVLVLTEYTRAAVIDPGRAEQVAELSRVVTAHWLLAAHRELRRGIEARC